MEYLRVFSFLFFTNENIMILNKEIMSTSFQDILRAIFVIKM